MALNSMSQIVDKCSHVWGNPITKSLLSVFDSSSGLLNRDNRSGSTRLGFDTDIIAFRYKKDGKVYMYNEKIGNIVSKIGFDEIKEEKILGKKYIVGIKSGKKPHTLLLDLDGNQTELMEGYYYVSSNLLKDFGLRKLSSIKLRDKKTRAYKEIMVLSNPKVMAEIYDLKTISTIIKMFNGQTEKYLVMSGKTKDGVEFEFCYNENNRRFYCYENNAIGRRIRVGNNGWLIL